MSANGEEPPIRAAGILRSIRETAEEARVSHSRWAAIAVGQVRAYGRGLAWTWRLWAGCGRAPGVVGRRHGEDVPG